MKRRTLTLVPRSGPPLVSQTTVALTEVDDETSGGYLAPSLSGPPGAVECFPAPSGYVLLIGYDIHGHAAIQVQAPTSLFTHEVVADMKRWLSEESV